VGGDALHVQRREFPLQLRRHREVEVRPLAGRAMADDRPGLARIVIAVVAEEHDAPAELGLEPAGSWGLGGQGAPREQAAGLLPERDDRLGGHRAVDSSSGARGPSIGWSSALNTMQAAQPIRLYQR